MHNTLQHFIAKHTPLIEEKLDDLLKNSQVSDTLQSSMAYSVKAGGKRIRPLLVLATLHDLGFKSNDGVAVACAIELIHTYSLIHDDLPSMDDDDFRRGKPTNHKVYGEATAILAGDALQTLAFQTLTTLTETPPATALILIKKLARASGADGMVGGQLLDIQGETKVLTLEELELVHLNKTGALLSFSIEAGAILSQISDEATKQLAKFAQNIGLAFQIKDDILDVTSTTEELGKTVGSDKSSHKSTYPSLLGLTGAQNRLSAHHELAKDSLVHLVNDQSILRLFADYIVDRNS